MTDLPRRITDAETVALEMSGQLHGSLTSSKAEYTKSDLPKGFFGQNLTGREFLPEDLTELALTTQDGVFATIPMDPSWTIERIWNACQLGACYAVYANLDDHPQRDHAWARLAGFGFRVTSQPSLPLKKEGSRRIWEMTFFEIANDERKLTAALCLC